MNPPLSPPEVEATRKLLTVFTPEQLEQLADLCMIVHDRAILRQCSQTLDVEINDKGYVRFFHASDNVPAVKPVTYKPE